MAVQCDTLPAAPLLDRKRTKRMSARCQYGSVRLVGKSWYGRFWRDIPEGKREHPLVVLGLKSEMTKAEAKRKLLHIIEAEGLHKPQYLAAVHKRAITFNSIADEWEAKRLPQLKPSTRYSAPLLLNKYLRPYFGGMPLDTIKTGIIDDWILTLKDSKHPKTIHNLYKLFRCIVNWERKQNDLPKRAWFPTLPDLPDNEQRWFTQEEMPRIIAAAKGQYRVFFHLAAYSALRSGELSGLHIGDLNLSKGFITVRRSVYKGQFVTTKTKRGFRNVNIDSITVKMLADFIDGRESGLVFETRNGTPLSNHNIVRQVLKPICKLLGIAPGGMHAFRHGRVSQLQTSGVPAVLTKEQVGHSSLRTTNGYTHFSEDYVRGTIEKLSQARCTQVV